MFLLLLPYRILAEEQSKHAKVLSEELSSVQEELDQQKRLNETLVRWKVHGLHPHSVLCMVCTFLCMVLCTNLCTEIIYCTSILWCLLVFSRAPLHHHTPLSLPLFCPNSVYLRIHRRGRVCIASVTHVWCPLKRLSTR